MKKPKHRPITDDALEKMQANTLIECQHCLWVTTVEEALMRLIRTGRCVKCYGMFRRHMRGRTNVAPMEKSA